MLRIGSFPYRPGFNPYQRLFTQSLEDAGIEVLRIPPRKWFPVQAAFATDCDVLHFDWPHDWYGGRNRLTQILKSQMYLAGLRKKSKAKLVWTAHNLVAHDSKDRDFEQRMIQALINRCDGIVVMSESAQKLLNQHYALAEKTKVTVAPHGHYIDCYANDFDRNSARRALGINASEYVYLSIGSVRPYKGHLALIDSFYKVATENDRLLIAGGCSDAKHAELIKSAAERCRRERALKIDIYLNVVPDEQMQTYFNASDICVLPFSSILNSGSLLMAMGFGIPTIAPRKGSITETVLPESSLLFEPSQKDALLESLLDAQTKFQMESPALRKSRAELIKKKYAWKHFANPIVKLYREILT